MDYSLDSAWTSNDIVDAAPLLHSSLADPHHPALVSPSLNQYLMSMLETLQMSDKPNYPVSHFRPEHLEETPWFSHFLGILIYLIIVVIVTIINND